MFLQGLNGQCFDVSGIGQVPEPGRPPIPLPEARPVARRRQEAGAVGQRRFRGAVRRIYRLLPQIDSAFQREMRRVVTQHMREGAAGQRRRRLTCKIAHQEAFRAALNQVRGANAAFRTFYMYSKARDVPFKNTLGRLVERFPPLLFID